MLLVSLGCGQSARHTVQKPIVPKIITHPVFQTAITGNSSARPAIQVDIKDASEDFVFTAELYLSVQSSRFPGDTLVILPLNVGDFAGCRTRFVQLPFEVEEGDTLLFNLLDNDKLNGEQEQLVVKGCHACGYCLLIAGQIYCPAATSIVRPAVPVAADILGEAIIQDVALHYFENFGTAEYIVPKYLPEEPQQANELSIRNDSNYVPAILKLFGPSREIPFSIDEST